MRNVPRHILVMGVSGAGKSTIGALLAARLGLPFLDADDLHPPANVESLAAGVPLSDAERWPWLAAVHGAWRDRGGVLACSALRRAYRAVLFEGIDPAPAIVLLRVAPAVVAARLSVREGHFASPAILPSQFEALEEPPDAITSGSGLPPGAAVEAIVAALGTGS